MKLASLFQDHMVLQRERPIPVWGRARPGETVQVTVPGAHAAAKADESGRWQVILPPQPAGGPLDLVAVADSGEVRLNDVWVGEVWLCSGQSNMAMKVQACRDAEREIAEARHPGIRLFTVARAPALEPRAETAGAWQVCDPATVGEFSAAAYFFGREIRRELGVAVGLLDSSWGGTVAEAWTSRPGLQGEPTLKPYVDNLDRFLGPDGEEARRGFEQAREEWRKSVPADPGNDGEKKGWHRPETAAGDWKTMTLPTGWQTAGHDFSGVFWFRREFDIPADWAGRDLELHVGACDKRDYTYLNGEFLGTFGMEDNPLAWQMPRAYTIPAARVKAGRQVAAVRVFSEMYQGGMIGPARDMWCAPVGAPESDRLPLDGPWQYRVERNFGKISTAPPAASYGEDNPNTPTVLFNGMIAPLVPLALRGFLWYQGESNAGRATEYRTLLPCLIRDWRRAFGQGDLPFYIVQLANFRAVYDRPTESEWAHLREAQRITACNVPRTGLAVILDVGEAGDIHPMNKQDVGRRLAACALANDYGRPAFAGSSPLPAAAWRRGAGVAVRFTHAAGGLRARGGAPLKGFALAGADREFRWAVARLDGPDTVVLTGADVPDPCWVRYAWADNPVCNLDGGTGLPASSFEIPVPFGEWLRNT